MKRIILVLIVIIAALFVGMFVYSSLLKPTPAQDTTSHVSPIKSTPTLVPTSSQGYCDPKDLQALVILSPGAGNVYGTFTLKNMSQQSCEILGGTFITPEYDNNTVKNITITHMGQTEKKPFILTPGTTIYSQVHYPNGPQCQSIGINTTQIKFTYKVSPTAIIEFKDPDGNMQQSIQTCKAAKDITEIQIWNMSTQPITP